MKHSQSGFSLLEVMFVIAIIGIMLGGLATVFTGNDDKARVTLAKQDIMALSQALDLFKLDNRRYPSTDQGLDALVNAPDGADSWAPNGYIKKLKDDPWGNPYQYVSPGSDGPYDLFSLGADGIEGGTDYGADISYSGL
jgi:general secretion pathway protein G